MNYITLHTVGSKRNTKYTFRHIAALHRNLLLYCVRQLTFFLSTSAYFVNGNTELMSDLTDN